MKFKIVWSQFSQDQLDDIFEYYLEIAGKSIALNLISSLISHTEYLSGNPEAGQSEVLLKDRATKYRYIVYRKYKIIYSVDFEHFLIKIADVFDTRQNPIKIKREK